MIDFAKIPSFISLLKNNADNEFYYIGLTEIPLERIRDHIYTSLHSNRVIDTIKVCFCLALHIQQLPTDARTAAASPSASSENPQQFWIAAAESLLALDEGPLATLEGIECLLLQSDFYINTGNLYKAWRIIRQVVSLIQLLRVPRKVGLDTRSKTAGRWYAVWSETWQKDRGFSLILGLPYAILERPGCHVIASDDTSSQLKVQHFFLELGVIRDTSSIATKDPTPPAKHSLLH